MQQAFGRMPDYKYQESEDFGIKSESLLEVWCNTRTTSLTVENLDYDTVSTIQRNDYYNQGN
jgi:hypothetical protein